jgi:hypothetical protein
MEFLGVFALSAVVAIIYNYVAGISSLSKFQTSYFTKTLFSTVVIFAAVVVAGFIFAEVESA